MNEHEGYLELGNGNEVYYLIITPPVHKWVCIEGMTVALTLEPDEALNLLAWLKQEQPTLERLAREQAK